LDSANNVVYILLGKGDGTFEQTAKNPVTGTAGSTPRAIATGDFNRDGIPDLAVVNTFGANAGAVTILLGNGDGTFTPAAASPSTGDLPLSIAVGDFNGDGIPDLAVANFAGNDVSILLGKGDGTFEPAASPATGDEPVAITAGNFNNDRKVDLVIASLFSTSVLLGNGDGTFT
jgi:hypothetical protein